MKIRNIVLPFILFTTTPHVRAQEYPVLRDINVAAEIIFEQAKGMFFYSYTVRNGSRSGGDLWKFQLDISIPSNACTLDTSGLRFNSTFIEGHFRRRYSTLEGKIVPVGVPSLPRFWSALFSNNLTLSMSADTLLPKPGEKVSDLIIMSKGLPGIRRFFLKPDFNEDQLFPSIEETTNALTFAQMDSIREAGNFSGLTIGAIAPPLNFSSPAWIDTLISYKHQAFALGWIKNQGIVTSLDAKLDNAKAQLQRNNNSSARNILQSFLNEVEALNKKGDQITSEAYALLKFNAEYLVSKL